MLRNRFLKKGFSKAVQEADPNIVEPIFTDMKDKEVHPSSINEAIKSMYNDELTLSGFRYKENATAAQKVCI